MPFETIKDSVMSNRLSKHRKPRGLKSVPGLMSTDKNAMGKRLPLAATKAFLAKAASESIYELNVDVMDSGGKLILHEMWRNPYEQYMKWTEFKMGLTKCYSPPPSRSMHEVGHAIDIDLRSEETNMTERELVDLLRKHNWFQLVREGPGCHHFEFRTKDLLDVRHNIGYIAMVELCWKKLKIEPVTIGKIDYDSEQIPEDWI
jgi:hypothetical protein